MGSAESTTNETPRSTDPAQSSSTNDATTQQDGQYHFRSPNDATTQRNGQHHCCSTNFATTQNNVAPSHQCSVATTEQLAFIKHNCPHFGCHPPCTNAMSEKLCDFDKTEELKRKTAKLLVSASYPPCSNAMSEKLWDFDKTEEVKLKTAKPCVSTTLDDVYEYALEKWERNSNAAKKPSVAEKPSVVEKTHVVKKTSVSEKRPVVTITKERGLKSLVKSLIKPPNKLNNLDDFITNWNVWKEQLTSFLELTDEKRERYHEWGSYFLHFMGPVGQQILQDLFFNNENDRKCYRILMQKYNSYYKFTTAVKSENETVEEYIGKLKSEVAQNIKNVDKTLKEKLAKEIEKRCKHRFTALAKSKFSNFNFETTFDSLTLTEIAFLWKICEESNFNSNENCKSCGSFHQEEKCPALGNECAKCKRMNHFSTYCPGLGYITNCSFCGGNHQLKRCPAYGEICSKCGRLNHFSWKCSTGQFLRECKFCSLKHLMDRSVCPAKNCLCSICGQRGHYDIKCMHKNKK